MLADGFNLAQEEAEQLVLKWTDHIPYLRRRGERCGFAVAKAFRGMLSTCTSHHHKLHSGGNIIMTSLSSRTAPCGYATFFQERGDP